jgi:hypothetical protein
MSISEAVLQEQAQRERFTAEALRISDAELSRIRMQIYHSKGDGYYIFRNFVPPEVVRHMRSLWTTIDPSETHHLFAGKENFRAGCPDYYARYEDGSTIFYNFLYADPLDEVTREVGVCVHMLRNRISGRNAFSDMHGPRTAVSYRVTINKNYENWIAPHRDFLDYERRMEKGQYDPSRLQATLFLSQKGEDYDGAAFSMARNDGREVVFGTDVPITPGDLVIWKYTNLHSVSQITTPPGKLGLLRIIFPIEDLSPPTSSSATQTSAGAATMQYGDLLNVAARRGIRGLLRRMKGARG